VDVLPFLDYKMYKRPSLFVKVDHLLVGRQVKVTQNFLSAGTCGDSTTAAATQTCLGAEWVDVWTIGSLMGPVGAPAQDEQTMENSVTSLLKSIDSTVVSSSIIIITVVVVVLLLLVVVVVVLVVVLLVLVVVVVVLGGGGGGGSGGGWWCCWQPFFLGALPLLTQGRWILVNIAQDVV